MNMPGSNLFVNLFEQCTAPMLIIDPLDSSILDANSAAAEFYGWSQAQLRQMKILDINTLPAEEAMLEIKKASQLGQATLEFRHRMADGSVKDIEALISKFTVNGKNLHQAVIVDITKRKQAEFECEVTIEFLRIDNECIGLADLIHRTVLFFGQISGCDAVGIRLQEGDDYPYFEARGFPAEFVAAENHLCQRDLSGQLVCDTSGNPVIDCMCGNVICGRFDPAKPFFTEHGSFWSNCTSDLLASTTEEDRQARTRNRCNGEGYESLALIPLRVRGERLGLLQLNNRAKNAFTRQSIALWERMADYLAMAISRFRAYELLAASEETHRSLFDGMLNGVAYCKMIYEGGKPSDFLYLSVNSAFDTLTGLKKVSGRLASEVIPGIRDSDRELIELYDRVATTGNPEVFERHVKAMDMWFHISVYSPKRGFFVAVFDVITARKNAEVKLRESETRLRTVIEAAPDAIFVHREGRFIFLNPAAIKLFGAATESELLGSDYLERALPAYHDVIRERMAYQLKEQKTSPVLEMECIRLDGSLVHVETTAAPVIFQGQMANVVFLRNISERKRGEEERDRLKEQIRQTQKLEALGVLAGGIAHDFNNLLGGAFGYLDMARECLEGPESAKAAKYLDHSLSIFDRARDLTRQLLTFAKGGNPVKKSGSLATLVKQTAQFILTGSNIGTDFRFPEGLWPCEFDENMVGQVVDNLVINAKQAMPNGGRIAITAENIELREELASVKPGPYIHLMVSDTGQGIPEEIMPKIFDPFFTTKETGNGLGLATCFSIIKKHGGHINAVSETGRGTTFHIYLPASCDFGAGRMLLADSGPDCREHLRHARILVMDDEDYIRDIVCDMLSSLECEISCAEEGSGALRMIGQALEAGKPFDCVLMDLTIPGKMGGREAIGRLRILDKKIVALALSGYSDDPVMANPPDYGFNGSIAKPFKKETLVQELCRLLNEAR